MKKALITGIAGQDGSYLSEYLIEKNYEVHGIVRKKFNPRASIIKTRQLLERNQYSLWRSPRYIKYK